MTSLKTTSDSGNKAGKTDTTGRSLEFPNPMLNSEEKSPGLMLKVFAGS